MLRVIPSKLLTDIKVKGQNYIRPENSQDLHSSVSIMLPFRQHISTQHYYSLIVRHMPPLAIQLTNHCMDNLILIIMCACEVVLLRRNDQDPDVLHLVNLYLCVFVI